MVKAITTIKLGACIYAEFRRNIGQLDEQVWYVLIGKPEGRGWMPF